MAGTIVLANGDWEVSGGGFRSMAEGVCRFLGDYEPEKQVKSELALAVDSALYFVDMTEGFSGEMLHSFAKAFALHLAEVQATERDNWPNPELYDGHLSRLVELQKLLEPIS